RYANVLIIDVLREACRRDVQAQPVLRDPRMGLVESPVDHRSDVDWGGPVSEGTTLLSNVERRGARCARTFVPVLPTAGEHHQQDGARHCFELLLRLHGTPPLSGRGAGWAESYRGGVTVT